ncbi:MAG: energy transducer TonB [bacterium]
MFNPKWKIRRQILTHMGIIVALTPRLLYSQDKTPTVVFYAAYIFEAKTNGDTLEFPLMPEETAIATLDNFSETAQGYIQKLRSIYSFQHFSLLSMIGGAFTIGLESNDGSFDAGTLYGPKKYLFTLSASCKSGPQGDLLPVRIEAQMDTTTIKKQKMTARNRVYLFKTLCTVKHAHPLVIGRPLDFYEGRKQAVFVVFTPFFQELKQTGDYDNVVANYQKVLQLTAGKDDLGGRALFKKLNHYFETKLNRTNTMTYEEIINPLPPPPPPPTAREDLPMFIPHDDPPTPIGGYAAIQKALTYPEIARKSGIEGKVTVWALINEEGNVAKTSIMTSLGPNGCDEAAMAAISAVKWKPAMQKNKPVAVWIAVPVEFRLK